MITWVRRARLRPAFSVARVGLLILFWVWGLGGIFGAIAIQMWINGGMPAEGGGDTEFRPLIEMAAVIWLGGLVLLGLSALMCSKYWMEEQQ
jgi:hypothetical protein